MTRGTMVMVRYLLFILTCILGIRQIESKDVSTKILNFLELFNGAWNNKDHMDASNTTFDFVEVRHTPVKVPALGDVPVVLVEVAINRVVKFINAAVVTEGEDGTIQVRPYNFTNVNKYKPGDYNIQNLKGLTPDQFQGDETCIATFEIIENHMIFGVWPRCEFTIDGKHPAYALILECDVHMATVPLFVNQTSPDRPYVFKRLADRLPVPDTPQDYVSACDKQQEPLSHDVNFPNFE